MTSSGEKALLPVGMVDLLPPQAEQEADSVAIAIHTLSSHGYERVKPPMLEFEETLFEGAGAALTQQTFRLMDPSSQRMMGLRADMTPQVVRLAATRLKSQARPLRLCYAGQVLRVRGNQLRSDRQVGQVGAEIIGSDSAEADAEIIALAAEALEQIGIHELTIDLALPTLVPLLIEEAGLSAEEVTTLREALDRKDAAAVARLPGDAGKLFSGLLKASGPRKTALKKLAALDLSEEAAATIERLKAVLERLDWIKPGLTITLDPVESRGFEYQTGLSFTFFAGGVRGELGRGGRYLAGSPEGASEPATGVTLYLDSILRAVEPKAAAPRVYIPLGADPAAAAGLRLEGYVTVAALEETDDPRGEAERLGCVQWLGPDGPEAVED
ncbi:MAG: ATP phosphoribosyltransferase regulatory subunit [Limibacillus sp.]|jgi:ATP phosphoribosyltransferase regulatory subunit